MRFAIRSATALLAAGLIFCLGALAQSAMESQPSLNPGDGLVVMGGPIRLGPDLYIHANDTHAVPGLKSLARVSAYAKNAATARRRGGGRARASRRASPRARRPG